MYVTLSPSNVNCLFVIKTDKFFYPMPSDCKRGYLIRFLMIFERVLRNTSRAFVTRIISLLCIQCQTRKAYLLSLVKT